jgi:hypothetical protein
VKSLSVYIRMWFNFLHKCHMVFNWYLKNAGVGEGGREAFTGYKIEL